MGTTFCPPVKQASRGDRRRTNVGRSPHSSLRTGKPSTWRRRAGDRGVLKPEEYSVYTEQWPLWSVLSVQKDDLSGLAEVCRGLRRAGYIGKRVRPVRRGAAGDRWLRGHTAPVVYSTVQSSWLFLNTAFGRDRNAAHATLSDGVPATGSFMFPQASLESRTVGFPESGSDLGSISRSLPVTREV